MPVIGTAGHVDHGKSTLVEALTGRDPDRWAEEKERGLTIDLGFAWTTLPSGVEAGFVDVPGHERFIKNMLAGVDAISVALLVVAADEGWMPQSEEHLAVLDLLGVSTGVVALTRADLVDADTLELAALDIDDRLAKSSLAGSPILPTAAPEGRGIDELKEALDTALASTSIADAGRPRMWIDRSFTIAGAGTVLTGTLVGGSLSVDDRVTIFPDHLEGRVRSIQSHERSLETVGPGNRTAVNVVGIERHDVQRGAMLGRASDWRPSNRFTVDLRAVRNLSEPVRERGSFHVHVGSGSWSARLQLVEGDTLTTRGAAVITPEAPVPVQWGDRVIVREVGRQAVVAGGVVLDPQPPRRTQDVGNSLGALRSASTPNEAAAALLAIRGTEEIEKLAAHTGGGSAPAAESTSTTVFDAGFVAGVLERAAGEVEAFHEANPLRDGVPKARLAEHIGVQLDDLDTILARSEEIEVVGASVRRVGFGVDLSEGDQTIWDGVAADLAAAGFGPPRRAELGLPIELEHALTRRGDLVEVSSDLLYRADTLQKIVEATGQISSPFTVADFRDALEITRKHAIPLLEWMDRTGVTVRDGDVRRLAG